MFGRKKRIHQENLFLNDVNAALADKTITLKEREILLTAKKEAERGKYLPRILSNLEVSLRPMALQSKLSKSVSKVYLGIMNSAYEDQGWMGMMFM